MSGQPSVTREERSIGRHLGPSLPVPGPVPATRAARPRAGRTVPTNSSVTHQPWHGRDYHELNDMTNNLQQIPKMGVQTLLLVTSCVQFVRSVQQFVEAPTYREVNPGGEVVLPCLVENKRGECRWEKDGTPVGMYENKYEWHGDREAGDCSLRVKEANIDYDNGEWQCQVTASDFTQRDTLISEGAELVVRGKNHY